jgi:hydroxyacylglutathione hydrolase
MSNVTGLKAQGTNLIYLHRCGHGHVFVIDPGNASIVLQALDAYKLTATAVLLTHHHWDHVGGVADLQAKTGCEVIGVDRTLIPVPDRVVADGDVLAIGEVAIQVLATPGHTHNSVCYYIPGPHGAHGIAYTGDTLFVGGCGRLLECDAATMWQSLQKLAALPDDTLVYCGHDYTLENYEFAVSIDPGNRRMWERLAEVQKTVEYEQPTVPSTIAQEKATNIFLQAGNPQIKTVLGMAAAPPEQVFAELRRRKDSFG